MLEERKRTYIIIKEIKLQTKAEKQLRKLANKPKNLYKNNSNYKGKSKAITPETSTEEEALNKELDEEILLMEMAAPTPARSWRKRNINLPKRYRN